MKFIFRRSFSRHAVDVWVFDQKGGKYIPAQPFDVYFDANMAFEEHSAFHLPEPTIVIPLPYAKPLIKDLIDGLVEAEMMPDPSAEKGELKATKIHLDDMRKIVLEKLLK